MKSRHSSAAALRGGINTIKAMGQLSLFDAPARKVEQPKVKASEVKQGEPDLQKGIVKAFDFDGMMGFLAKMNKDFERQNKELERMINDLQSDWTEDEKLQINDPKEYARQQKLREQIKIEEPVMAKELTLEAVETLKNSKVNGMVVMLPDGQLDRNVYTEVKNKLELIGGKWKGGKVGGFVFNEDPTDLLEQISNGENRNLKKEFQFFGTPDSLADQLVELAELQWTDEVLEPSAGQGAIVRAIQREKPVRTVWGYELMPLNQTFLNKITGFRLLGNDFLTECETTFDKIIANPPFAKNQDIDHILHMYRHLRPGGRLVSVASTHWRSSSNKKESGFREWISDVDAEVIEVPAGAFKESGTTVPTVIIVINA